MCAPSINRRPAGRRPAASAPSRRARPISSVGVAVAVAATLLAMILASASLDGATASGGGTGTGGGDGSGGSAIPYRDDGMWIWYVSQSAGGNPVRIARKANRHGIETVYIKSSDGQSEWSQFTPALVAALHARGLRVCAWQFVYGSHPGAEARRGAEAVAKGADCLVVDAEGDYEGRYAAADAFVDKLRRRIGSHFPTALASFPYVDYHPALPYSVFLGPGGLRFNLPQLYWHAIGVGVGEAYEHTFQYNRVYRSPIYPLGQTYENPPIRQIQKFRRMAVSYDLDGVSWWSWQETNRLEWRALKHPVTNGVAGVHRPYSLYPQLSKGSKGDLVVWAQEHLKGAGYAVRVTGIYGHKTVLAVKRFQSDNGLPDVGQIGSATWPKLLQDDPKMVDWSSKGSPRSAKRSSTAEPRSASLPAVRDEIPPPRGR